MPVQTKTVGSAAAVYNGKADMTDKGYTKEQLVKNANGRIVLKSRSESSTGRGVNKALDTWRECVKETRQEGDSAIPSKGSVHYDKARSLYEKKMNKSPAEESKGGWFSL